MACRLASADDPANLLTGLVRLQPRVNDKQHDIEICARRPDCPPTLLFRGGIGKRYRERIIVSIRTTNIHGHAGRFLRQLIGKRGTAGGHGMIAGGQLTCATMEHDHCTEIEEELIKNFLKKLGHKDVAETAPLLVTEPIS